MNDTIKYWVGFSLVRGIGAVRLRAILDTFGDLETAWDCSAQSLRAAGISTKIADNFRQVKSSQALDKALEKIHALQISVLTWNDSNYPSRLLEITNPPPVLYVRGNLLADDEWAVAVIGTRRVTSYGRQITENISTCLARNGVTVISGLARGADSLAHNAALNAGGRTLAVLGSGVDQIYPPENRKLAERIMQNGALISDYAPGTPPEGRNFPPRNRIISGLSLAISVVEAPKKSGALITASYAAEQGRDVFAVPGNILAPQSKGTNLLIQKGAYPLLDPMDILETLNLTRVAEYRAARAAIPANPTEKQLLELLGYEALHVDEIQNQIAMPIEKVTSTLTLMELKGMVRPVGGMRYMAVREVQELYQTGIENNPL